MSRRRSHAGRPIEPAPSGAGSPAAQGDLGIGGYDEVPEDQEAQGPDRDRVEEPEVLEEEGGEGSPAAPVAKDPLAEARALEAVDPDRAMELYRAALLERPDTDARLALARLHTERGDHTAALEQLEAAREENPEYVPVQLAHAAALAALNRFELAERELRRLTRVHPELADAWSTLGSVSFRRGLYAQAEHELKRAIELDPEGAVAYHYRGECLNQLGRVDEALQMLERAAVLQPDHARTYYVMGILLDRKHRPQEAAAMYRKAREVAPA